MGQSTSRTDFSWKTDVEPHHVRRAQILKAHPEIQTLFVVDPTFKWKVTGLVLFQFLSLYLFQNLSWWLIVPLAYALSGTINHSLMLAIHEISHSHAFGYSYPNLNKWFGLFANLPIGIPISCSFKKYHLLHHRYQGDESFDTDLPTAWEGRTFRSPVGKALWLFLQPVFYGIRPFVVKPLPASLLEITNVIVEFAFDVLIYYLFGGKMVFYLAGGSILAMGLHPMAGHVISEHYLWEKGSETYSYYGPLNWITWNVGYHMAHHDFPAVPGSLLPQVHKIAPEFYDSLPWHDSWSGCLWKFITDPDMGPFNRVKRRSAKEPALARKIE